MQEQLNQWIYLQALIETATVKLPYIYRAIFLIMDIPIDLIGYPLTKGASPYLIIDINTNMC